MRKAVCNVTFVDSYENAPVNARYILRKMYDSSWRLERYSKDGENVQTVKEFSSAFWAEEFHDMLKQSRRLAGPRSILWVERPNVLMESFNPELDELYKEFIHNDIDDYNYDE